MIDANEFLSQLNPAQREAVEAVDGPLLIIAGAGSGKTRVITYRIAYMLRYCGVQPWNLLAVTFTNKAAGEMRRRVIELIDEDPGPALQISTFHSSCARLLRREAYKVGLSSNFTICDASDQIAVIKDCLKTLDYAKDDIVPGMVANVITESKMRMLTAKDYAEAAETPREEMAAEAFALYEKRLRENDAVDFDDLLCYVVRLFDESPETLAEYQHRYGHILVDEYQDTNHVQYRLVEALAREHRNICVVGDEDQCIYSWRGAEISNLLDFQKHFNEAKIVRLEQNYRSTQAILSVADVCITNNEERLGKNLWTARDGGDKPTLMICADGREEAGRVIERVLYHHANGYHFRDMAVFYRANWLSRPFEDRLRESNIPYRIIGGIKFYERAEIKDILSYLNVIENPLNSIAFLRVINKPRRGIGDKSIGALQQLADARGVSCYAAIEVGLKEKAFSRGLDRKLEQLREMIESWRKLKANGASLTDLLRTVLKDTQYEEKLGDPDDFEVINRRENIAELGTVIGEFEESNPSSELGDFLEMISLRTSVDDMDNSDAVSLMTLHCAKGLEYKVVFLVALEDTLFPNQRAVEERGNLEEERRLFYVGVTRAEDHLYISRAESRYRFGQTMYNRVSRFLLEVPPSMVNEETLDDPGEAGVGVYVPGRGRSREFARRAVQRESIFDRPPTKPKTKPESGDVFADIIRSANKKEDAADRDARGRTSPNARAEALKQVKQAAKKNAVSFGSARQRASARFDVGQRVRHAIFGDGVIKNVDGRETEVEVQFDNGDTRLFDARYAGLKEL